MSGGLRVAFFGTPKVATAYLQALLDSPHEVCVVVTQPDRPAGRSLDLRASPVKSQAVERALCVLQPERCEDEQFVRAVRGCEPDLGVVVAYGELLPPAALACPGRGCVNIHYSLLPALRGAAPVQHALLQGLGETGVTVQWMSEALDAGDLILQERVAIGTTDDQATLLDRLTDVGTPLLLRALDLIAADQAPRVPQDGARATWAPELTTAQCRVDWSRPASAISNLVRACNPKPGAHTFRGDKRLKVLGVEVVGESGARKEGPPGTVVETGGRYPAVVTGEGGAVVLLTVKPEGRSRMSGADFARGARFAAGERLE